MILTLLTVHGTRSSLNRAILREYRLRWTKEWLNNNEEGEFWLILPQLIHIFSILIIFFDMTFHYNGQPKSKTVNWLAKVNFFEL